MQNDKTNCSAAKPKANLSCLQCQRRKRKCDKTHPCQACNSAGLDCTPVSRARLPRGRHAVQKDGDLRQRVARLERLLSLRSEVDNASVNLANSDDVSSSNKSPDSAWSLVSEEVVGIRDLLDGLAEAELELEPEPGNGDIEVQHQSFDVLLYGDLSCFVQPHVLEPPPQSIVSMLVEIYLTRIDPLFKVTHAPFLRATLLAGNSPTPSQKALEFAVIFTALSSLQEHESLQLFGENKSAMSGRFKLGAEVLFSRCGLLTTTNLILLQAFVIYLAGLRACNGPRAACVLLGTAVRVAQFLGLDVAKVTHSPFEAEMRRRIWYSIGILELQAAFDSGSYSAIATQVSLKSAPLHINDEDIDLSSPVLPQARETFSDMTFACASHEMLRHMRRMIYTPLDSDGQPILNLQPTWAQRFAIVDDCARCLNDKFIKMCDPTDRFHCFVKLVCEAMVVTLRLLAHRPMYHIYSSEPPPDDGFNVLDVTTQVLEQCLRKVENTEFKQWEWFAWSKWYALAILLAELCEHTNGPQVERAWVVSEACFERFKVTIQDQSLWRSIEKLMNRARSARAKHTPQRHDLSSIALVPGLPATDLSDWTMPVINGFGEPQAAQIIWTDQEPQSWTSWENFVQDLGNPIQFDATVPEFDDIEAMFAMHTTI